MTAQQTGRIFISYRRDDSAGYAGRIYDRLAAHFGKDVIFMDVDTIEAGLDFVEVLETAVQSCDVLVALIGKQWLHIQDEAGNRRLDNPQDFVRVEVTAALKRGIRVIPALVEGTPMPNSNQLPRGLKALARRNAVLVSHPSFHTDASRLIEQLELALKAAEESKIVKAKEQKEKEAQEKRQAEIEKLLTQADVALDLQGWDLAKEKLEAVLKLDPEHPQAQVKFAIAERKLRENDEQDVAEENVKRVAAQKAAMEETVMEVAEKAANEKAEREAAEKVAREKAERKAAREKGAREKAAREAGKKPALEKADFSHLGRNPLKGEHIILNFPAVRRFMLNAHLDCKVILTNKRLVFWDPEKEKYSFEISIADLRQAKFDRKYTDDLVIELKNGTKFEIGLNENDYWKKITEAIENL